MHVYPVSELNSLLSWSPLFMCHTVVETTKGVKTSETSLFLPHLKHVARL